MMKHKPLFVRIEPELMAALDILVAERQKNPQTRRCSRSDLIREILWAAVEGRFYDRNKEFLAWRTG